MKNSKKDSLDHFWDFLIGLGKSYDKNKDILVQLAVTYGVIYFLLKIVTETSSEYVRVAVVLVILYRIITWIGWMFYDQYKKKGGDK